MFNSISDPDQARDTLNVAQEILRSVSRPVLNSPSLIANTTREGMADQLSGIENVVIPRTVRIRNLASDRIKLQLEMVGLNFPVILRLPGEHNGKTVALLKAPPDSINILGARRSQYSATEFVDYRSPDGLYRKYRVWFIGS